MVISDKWSIYLKSGIITDVPRSYEIISWVYVILPSNSITSDVPWEINGVNSRNILFTKYGGINYSMNLYYQLNSFDNGIYSGFYLSINHAL